MTNFRHAPRRLISQRRACVEPDSTAYRSHSCVILIAAILHKDKHSLSGRLTIPRDPIVSKLSFIHLQIHVSHVLNYSPRELFVFAEERRYFRDIFTKHSRIGFKIQNVSIPRARARARTKSDRNVIAVRNYASLAHFYFQSHAAHMLCFRTVPYDTFVW